MSGLRPESHVAQQIRRDKLRIQNNLEDFPTNIEQLSLHPGFSNSDLLQVRNVRNASNMLYEPPPPAFYNTSSDYNYASFPHSDQPRDHHMAYGWMPNYGSTNPNTNFASELSNNNNNSNVYNELVNPPNSSPPPPLFQNTLQDIVKSASGLRVWTGNQFNFENANFSGDSVNNPQGLSLSLSSSSSNSQSTKSIIVKPSSSPSASVVARDCGKSVQDQVVVGGGIASNNASGYRNVGPLGPFTGYATILKSSRFLKPAQELLDEFCGLCGPNNNIINASDSGKDSSNAGGASSSGLYGSKENSGGCSSRPEYQQRKAKLLYMQEEVTRKYKQYHQQMQMVVSSFESVAGLSSATPYISMALRSITKHFRCLKNAILDQIKHIGEMLGEDLSGSTSGTSCSKLDTDMARLRYIDQSFQKNKTGFLEPQQVWRPQRGLPERAVAILKAWLFEHFLHPYPTDTDKHMLATQTGLSRNQVSNWFINARVRVWKPMVEEIHNLETKGLTKGGSSKNNDEGTSAANDGSCSQQLPQGVVDIVAVNKFGKHHGGDEMMCEKQFQCLEMSSLGGGGEGFLSSCADQEWNQEKRSKMECQTHITPPNMDGTLMGFVPYRREGGGSGGVDHVGGLGSVSLTLGLRHGVEGVQHQHHQQQQQHLQQEDQLRRHFGEHMIHDFVG